MRKPSVEEIDKSPRARLLTHLRCLGRHAVKRTLSWERLKFHGVGIARNLIAAGRRLVRGSGG